jgi:hypothetical protein
MSSFPQIEDLQIDDENIEKMWAHGVLPEQLLQMLGNRPLVIANRKDRRGIYLVIGRDDGGACIATPIEPTPDPVVWRPITAWPCKKNEEGRLR